MPKHTYNMYVREIKSTNVFRITCLLFLQTLCFEYTSRKNNINTRCTVHVVYIIIVC